jgi:transposase
MCISKQTGYGWLEEWNEQGHDGLKPRFGGGRPSKLGGKQKKELKHKLKSKDNWLTSEVRALIRREFDVSYSIRHTRKILRSFKMHYAKPYPRDYRQPKNAKKLLADSLQQAVKDAPVDYILGFLDQAAPQTTDNKQRFWSFTKPRIVKNTSKYRANTFGFYPINGKEVVDFKESSKAPQVCEFLRLIRDKNPVKHIIVILDNARSHIAGKTRRLAESLNITLVFLPTYSPKLNPIEQIWKSIRRKISQIFVKSEWAFKETIRTTFHYLAKKSSFSQEWLNTYKPILSNLL